MGFVYPRRVDGSIESNDRVHAAMWAERSLVLIVTVAPLRYRSRWKLAKAVEADRNFAGEQLLSVHGRLTRSSHVFSTYWDGGVVRHVVAAACHASLALTLHSSAGDFDQLTLPRISVMRSELMSTSGFSEGSARE